MTGHYMAEGEGFEPPVGLRPTAVFKTAAIDHSATPPADWQGVRDLNPQPTVLETATLPIELTPCLPIGSLAIKPPSQGMRPYVAASLRSIHLKQ